jgi:hypothetical protein
MCVAGQEYEPKYSYEPRGRGFNSCQPHQMDSPETAMFQGFFISNCLFTTTQLQAVSTGCP